VSNYPSEVTQYLEEIGRHPVLCEEAQLHHARRIHRWVKLRTALEKGKADVTDENRRKYKAIERNGRRSMDAMVRTNLRIVVGLAKRHQYRGLELADLIQEGNQGLIKGLERFDPARGYRISTYVYWWIRQGINRALQVIGRSIRVPINHFEVIHRAEVIQGEILAETGKTAPLETIARKMKMAPDRLKEIIDTYSSTFCISYDIPTKGDGSTLFDFIQQGAVDPTSPLASPEDDIDARRNSDLAYLDDKLEELPWREGYILREYYINHKTTHELAAELGVGPSRINQLQQSGLKRIREMVKGYEFDSFR
jgi:RNA polymerase sigma factor (sigma-70 family)